MSQTVVVAAPPGLSSPAVYLFDAAGDTVLNTGGDTLAPGSNATGKYSSTVAETLNGWHYYEVRVSSTVIRNGFAKLTDGGTIYLGEITSTEVAAVQSGLSTLAAADIRTAVGLASANLDSQLADLPTNSELTTALAAADDAVLAAIAALNNLSAAQVNAEVVDALATDTYAEPGQGAPAATTTLAAKINYLYKSWRNKKTQTSTTLSIFDDAGTTVDQKSTTSDSGGTTTIGEIATGP